MEVERKDIKRNRREKAYKKTRILHSISIVNKNK